MNTLLFASLFGIGFLILIIFAIISFWKIHIEMTSNNGTKIKRIKFETLIKRLQPDYWYRYKPHTKSLFSKKSYIFDNDQIHADIIELYGKRFYLGFFDYYRFQLWLKKNINNFNIVNSSKAWNTYHMNKEINGKRRFKNE